MYSYLNTMPYSVPWDYQRLGGFGFINDLLLPVTSLSEFISFIMPSVESDFTISSEYLVRVDKQGHILERYTVSDWHQDAFMEEVIDGTSTIAYSAGPKDILPFLQINHIDRPVCGIYYYEVFFALKNHTPPPKIDPNAEKEPLQLHFKTEMFYIDTILTSQDPSVPGIGVPSKGDFSPFDFNDDFFTAI